MSFQSVGLQHPRYHLGLASKKKNAELLVLFQQFEIQSGKIARAMSYGVLAETQRLK